eukprot:TRINITY_DN529_c0_g1_i1.p1 TRINITY_DN529_c0_g1~~TRINITY_DN529_c0_g1_i1.p1  ORF type:complete len:900 (-),score=182.64 TRINITY_DN529_c0_g1_i1:24-2723(-)
MAMVSIKCNHSGCEEVLPFNKIIEHIEECEKRPVDCPYGCGADLTFDELEKHEYECENKTILCSCGVVYVSVAEQEHFLYECTIQRMCPYCNSSYPLKDKAEHENTCIPHKKAIIRSVTANEIPDDTIDDILQNANFDLEVSLRFCRDFCTSNITDFIEFFNLGFDISLDHLKRLVQIAVGNTRSVENRFNNSFNDTSWCLFNTGDGKKQLYIKNIQKIGFPYVRLPIDEDNKFLEGSTAGYTFIPDINTIDCPLHNTYHEGCPFRHPRYKSQICTRWKYGITCNSPKCKNAHPGTVVSDLGFIKPEKPHCTLCNQTHYPWYCKYFKDVHKFVVQTLKKKRSKLSYCQIQSLLVDKNKRLWKEFENYELLINLFMVEYPYFSIEDGHISLKHNSKKFEKENEDNTQDNELDNEHFLFDYEMYNAIANSEEEMNNYLVTEILPFFHCVTDLIDPLIKKHGKDICVFIEASIGRRNTELSSICRQVRTLFRTFSEGFAKLILFQETGTKASGEAIGKVVAKLKDLAPQYYFHLRNIQVICNKHDTGHSNLQESCAENSKLSVLEIYIHMKMIFELYLDYDELNNTLEIMQLSLAQSKIEKLEREQYKQNEMKLLAKQLEEKDREIQQLRRRSLPPEYMFQTSYINPYTPPTSPENDYANRQEYLRMETQKLEQQLIYEQRNLEISKSKVPNDEEEAIAYAISLSLLEHENRNAVAYNEHVIEQQNYAKHQEEQRLLRELQKLDEQKRIDEERRREQLYYQYCRMEQQKEIEQRRAEQHRLEQQKAEQLRLERIAEQQRLERIAEQHRFQQQRFERIAEQQRLEKIAEQQRLEQIAEQQRFFQSSIHSGSDPNMRLYRKFMLEQELRKINIYPEDFIVEAVLSEWPNENIVVLVDRYKTIAQ